MILIHLCLPLGAQQKKQGAKREGGESKRGGTGSPKGEGGRASGGGAASILSTPRPAARQVRGGSHGENPSASFNSRPGHSIGTVS